jgi:DNA mismatch repair ATPase MutS
MDEIFVSTNYQEGMSGFYAIIKKLCKFTKCLNVITTHFDVLAKMDELNIDKKYFDIEINEKTDKIVKDFKVKSGVSKKHMALKLLKNKGFDPEIIKDAEFLYNKLCSEKTDVIEKDNVKADVKADIKADIDTKPDTKPDTKLDTKPDIEDDIEYNIKDTDLYNPKTT